MFLSLLFSTEMAVLYSPSNPANIMRNALAQKLHGELAFWLGLGKEEMWKMSIFISVKKPNFFPLCLFLYKFSFLQPYVYRSFFLFQHWLLILLPGRVSQH